MVGRGAYGAPWMPARIAASSGDRATIRGRRRWPSRATIAAAHVEAMLEQDGPVHGLRNARKHIGWYLASSGRPPDAVKAWRRRLCTSENARDVLAGLATFYAASAGGPHERRSPHASAPDPSPRRHIEHDLLLAALPHPDPGAGRRRPRALRQRRRGIVLLAQPGHAEAADAARHHRLLEPARRRWSGRCGAPAPPSTNTASTSACRAAACSSWSTCSPARMPDHPGLIVLMLQQRSMAQMIERQLTHRAAARSVSGMAAVLAHEIKNPLSGIRGAAQLLEPGLKDDDRALTQLICTETDRIRNLVDRMEVFGDERPLGDRAGQHPLGARSREAPGARRALPRASRSASSSTPRCRRWPATATSSSRPSSTSSRTRRKPSRKAASRAASCCAPPSGRACAWPCPAAARASACR